MQHGGVSDVRVPQFRLGFWGSGFPIMFGCSLEHFCEIAGCIFSAEGLGRFNDGCTWMFMGLSI